MNLSDSINGDKFVLRGQLHLKMALDAGFGEVALNIASRKLDAATVVCYGGDIFGNALVDGQELVVAKVESKADELIAGHKNGCAGLSRHS